MPSHQTSSDKPRSSKCRHFCFVFETHNYCPTCTEAGKGDDPCVTNEKPCNICSVFTEEELIKIKHRCRYVRKQKVFDTCNTSKDDDLDLLGAFSGSQADLEGAAENIFSSAPHPQPLRFESLSLRTLQTVPPTPGTALQNKIESKLEKSLVNQFSIQLQQHMGVFQASMLEAKTKSWPLISSLFCQECNTEGGKCKISRVLQSPVPSTKPHPRWGPLIDLNRLNIFLHVEKFKMETPESIRTSLIPGEWVSSIDLSDPYLHIPTHPNSRKYLRFCYKSQVFQFTSFPFGLATAPRSLQ